MRLNLRVVIRVKDLDLGISIMWDFGDTGNTGQLESGYEMEMSTKTSSINVSSADRSPI